MTPERSRKGASEKTADLPLDDDALYAAMEAHDARFDGRFFCGVSSTGIYCRPVCRVRLPKRENCAFFVSAAAAEAAGYRPCLRCRPELAPGEAPMDASGRLARRAALLMEEDGHEGGGLAQMAAGLGITDRHLRRVFFAEYGVSPVQYLQTGRLLLAKSLLSDTRLSTTEVAMAAGFGSIRRFNDLIKRRYRLAPGSIRTLGRAAPGAEITLSLGYRPPYAWESLIDFLGPRAIPGIEAVTGETYVRTATIRKGGKIYDGWISVGIRPKANSLSVTIAPSLLPVLSIALRKVRFLFDINCDPEKVYEKLAASEGLGPDLLVRGIRLPGAFDPFETSVRTILGQQVTIRAASTLAGRMAQAFGRRIETPYSGVSLAFPEFEEICGLPEPIEEHLGPLGIIGPRARSILALALALREKRISFSHGADPMAEMKKLRALPGFGPWTIECIAMRALGWPDSFPRTDYGVRKALGGLKPKEIMTLSSQWSPWRSYATILLWRSLARREKSDAPYPEVGARQEAPG